jgi:thiamine pyrophosphate-dependent acetolactate synthase large subunit-like protein
VAISAADGYARLMSKPQCVLVHVDVGTNALGQGLHNASSGKVPILIFAGLAPYTLHGELSGSRSEHVQWYQDVPNQNALVSPFSRYCNEIKTGDHVQMIVNRALLMATTSSPGPVYLTATREVLAASTKPPKEAKIPSCGLGGLTGEAMEIIGKALINAQNPLVVTGYIGRNHSAVERLIQLTNAIGSLTVFDSEQREMSFPADHAAWLTRSTGAGPAIKAADVILVLDADVPWIPTKVHPKPEAKIYHIDLDPRKEKMNLFDIYADATYNADTATALDQLCAFVKSKAPDLATKGVEKRKEAYEAGLTVLVKRAQPQSDGLLRKDFLFRTLREAVPNDTIFVHDAVTNQGILSEQLQLTQPGSNFSKGGSGLGWACGAAIGISLASKRYKTTSRPNTTPHANNNIEEKFICTIIGDGSFMFSSPSAAYWASTHHKTPTLTIIINNGGWKATRACVNDVHPTGIAAGMTDEELGVDLKLDGPDYCGIARAACNGRLWTGKVERCDDLGCVLGDAVRAVQGGMGAVVDAVVVD